MSKVAGKKITTIEGLEREGRLHPIQQAFVAEEAFQCGYCTPGMLMAGTALLAENPHPTRDEVVAGIDGNICRCTGYLPIIDAILQAAASDDDGNPANPGTSASRAAEARP